MPRLSVCLIVKNEERHLPRCLASVSGLADEIVVVDTGSTDRTVEIAKAHGARVAEIVWRDDFSFAKNASIEQATGDWILSLDADETIAARDHAAIRAVLDRDDVDAVLAAQRHYLASRTTAVGWQPGPGGYEEGEPYPGFVDVDCRRLFRNAPRLRFRNRVHEELVSTDPWRPLVEERGTWVIHHFGKLGDEELLRAKGVAYLRIGRKKLDEDPRNPQAHYELGIQHAELNQPAEAFACFSRAMALSPNYRDAQFRLALCHVRLTQYREALAALRRSARTLPALALEIALVEGNVHRELGDDDAAAVAFRRALARNPGFAPARLNLALLLDRQGGADAALACLDEGLERSPRHRGMAVLKTRILARFRRFSEARAMLAAIGDDGPEADLSGLRGAVALGLGELPEAIDCLRVSLDHQPTEEAAMNLCTALEARGDREGALAAAAEAVRLAPDGPAADRFAALAGDRFRRRAEGRGEALTIFFHQPHSLAYDGSTPRTRGLGGTESAIVYLAEALAKRGHRAVVFNGSETPSHVEGVEYVRWDTLAARCASDRPDVLVAIRFWQTIGRARLAPLQIFWTGDAYDQPFVEALGDPAARREIDLFMLQSDWQVETFQAQHDIPRGRIVRTTLGTAASAAASPAPPAAGPRPRRLAYASTPFRGLDVLLHVFPRIRAACPDAELEVFSSMKVYGVSEAEDRRQFQALYDKARQPGVTLVGSVPQLELAQRLQQARVLAYPNHYRETFCIAAVEAQAAGCAVVTSDLGALPETVGEGGICIPGDPRTPTYQRAFVDACVALLRDDDRWQTMSRQAMSRTARDYAWAVIAERWEAVCRAGLLEEPAELERIAVHLAAGRAGLAQRMLARTPRPGTVPADAWAALAAFTDWRAGQGPEVPPDQLRLMTVAFRSLRNLESAVEA